MRCQQLSYYSKTVDPLKEKLISDYLLPGNVLDAGCGNGLYGLKAFTLGCNILQLDLEDRRLGPARDLPFRQMDVQVLDFDKDSYDNIFAFDIMEHLDDDACFLREAQRICRGRIFISVPCSEYEQLGQICLTHIHYTDKTHRREYTREEIIELLERFGFRIIVFKPHMNNLLPYFANILKKEGLLPRIASRFISLQCLLFEKIGLFENRCIADWYCVAEKI